MNPRYEISRHEKRPDRSRAVPVLVCLFALAAALFAVACSELEKPKAEEFYADSDPPPKQEFRWSNGQLPTSFDPARAAAPPETDIVRAVYEGLTESDPKTLRAIPAIAYKWTASDDKRTWTFQLRRDARWSNGEAVTAADFVRSWKRLAGMGEEVSHHELLKNIVGMRPADAEDPVYKDSETIVFSLQERTRDLEQRKQEILDNISVDKRAGADEPARAPSAPPAGTEAGREPKTGTGDKKKDGGRKFGFRAVDDHTLEVSLIKPDPEFPELVANPIFRPVYAGGSEFKKNPLNPDIVTNGAFRVLSVGPREGVTLERAEHYYNRRNVWLERVRFVPAADADSALAAYRQGKVDAVTNAKFEPLALKILLPFTDFKKVTHSALNFYEFNRKKAPFNDRRVREALAIAIDRERLTTDEMEGATKPAFNYLPFEQKRNNGRISENAERARKLLGTAGYPEGRDFPTIRLVINRNNMQERIAKAVAGMWKENLNVETEIVVREFEELERVKREGEFDVVRRGIVLPTTDETANMLAIFSPRRTPRSERREAAGPDKTEQKQPEPPKKQAAGRRAAETPSGTAPEPSPADGGPADPELSYEDELLVDTGEEDFILTEAEAILEVPAIPLYFPTSYSLVKPYVLGFELNTLDAPLLKDVRIDNNWQPKKSVGES